MAPMNKKAAVFLWVQYVVAKLLGIVNVIWCRAKLVDAKGSFDMIRTLGPTGALSL
jgi:hypothetical protein